MFDWLKKIKNSIKQLNSSIDTYKEETNNQTIPTVAYINKAKKMIDIGDFLVAIDILNDALLISEKDALVFKYLGVCYENLGNTQEAIKMYDKSAHINPQDKNIWYKLGLIQIKIKEYETAEKSFEYANKVAPMNTDILTAWGMSFFKQKEYMKAHEKFTYALKINMYNFSAILLSAISEVRMGKYDDAEKKFSFLLKANPSESSTYEYANLYFIKGNYKEALRYAQQSIIYNTKMLPAYLLAGKIYSLQFDMKKSTECFEAAVAQDLASPLLYAQWGDAFLRLCCFEKAIDMYNRVMSCEQDSDEIKPALALCYAEIGDFKTCEEYINLIKQKFSDNVYSVFTFGLIAKKNGNYEEAINYFKKVLNQDSSFVYSYYHLAKCYEALGNRDMIKDSYEKLLKFNDKFVDGYLEYAKFLIKNKDYKNAQRKLRKANNLCEQNQEVSNLLFYTCYVLVKENICAYNVKEAITIANGISDFKYPELKIELEELLKNIKE